MTKVKKMVGKNRSNIEISPLAEIKQKKHKPLRPNLAELEDIRAKFLAAEEALRQSEERYRTVADFTYDWEVWRGEDGSMLYVSPSCERISGYPPNMFISQPEFIRSIIHPEDKTLWEEAWSDSPGERKSIDFRIIRKDGRVVWIAQEAREVYGQNSKFLGVRYSKRDITERRKTEEALKEAREYLEQKVLDRTRELEIANEHLHMEIVKSAMIQENLQKSREQLRRLSSHLQELLEEERKRIAREIHDELGQNLTALNMGIARLSKMLSPNQPEIKKKLDSMKVIIKETIGSVQRISRELRPGHLDDLGLDSALEWHIRDFQETTGIRVDLMIKDWDILLDPEKTTDLYRVFQEALTNVARHAKASRVDVLLSQTPSQVEMEIRDNGVGIHQREVLDPNSFGLIGMQERVRRCGGILDISGSPRLGTKVRITVPVTSG